MNEKILTICYFGIYPPTASRDKVYLDGLRKRGFKVLECVDSSRGFSKFFRACGKHENKAKRSLTHLRGAHRNRAFRRDLKLVSARFVGLRLDARVPSGMGAL